MKKILLALVLGCCSFGRPSAASAQTLGKPLDVVFSGDRLFGVTFTREATERFGQRDRILDTSRVSFGWGGRGVEVLTPYEIPRAAVDVFVAEQLSIGGSLGFASVSYDRDDGKDRADYDSFIFAPRVGYIWGLSDVFSFWLRGGISYHSNTGGHENGLGLTVEPTFVLMPAEHFGIVFGPTLDLDLVGGVDDGRDRVDRHYRTLGLLQVGILGWL